MSQWKCSFSPQRPPDDTWTRCRPPASARRKGLQTAARAAGNANPARRLSADKDLVAEGVGFEPTVRSPAHTLSKRAP